MNKLWGILLACMLCCTAAAANVGDWSMHLAYHNTSANVVAGEEIYAVFEGNLLAYRPKDNEVRFFSRLNGLNGKNITRIGYSESEKCVVLLYDNFQIDLFYPQDETVVSIPQIRQTGADRLKSNNLFVNGSDALISVNDGVIHISLSKQEIVGYYVLNKNIGAAALYKDYYYASDAGHLYRCAASGNPLDFHEWEVIQNAAFFKFLVCGDYLYGSTVANQPNGYTTGLWLMNADGISFKRITDAVYPLMSVGGTKLTLVSGAKLRVIDAQNPTTFELDIKKKNSWKGVSRMHDGTFWMSDGYQGLQAYTVAGDSLKMVGDAIGNYGPRRDLCYYMRPYGNKLYIAGGRLDPYDRDHYPGTIMTYENGKWDYFQEEGIHTETGVKYRDITSVVVDPKNPDHVVATSGGTGLYDFEKQRFSQHTDNTNSPLQSAAGKDRSYVRLDGLNYDAKGNLWVVNNTMQDTILRARRPDGSWKSFYFEPIKKAPTCEKTLIDSKGRLWMASRRTVENHSAGLFFLDYNQTLDNTKDDVFAYKTTFVNQDGKSYTLGGVYCMVEDADGSIWVGTKAGLFIITQPDDYHKAGSYETQIKIPRNDGTNLADYLLSEVPISAIAIDGAGRKWIGTISNGLYLVSKDGMKVLEHFDMDNSPLLSNYIYSLAPNPETGEVMIGTDKGICSYQSGASQPEPSLDKNRIKVYPNPVRPEYHGNVTVKGLTEDAEVKVMTASGEVVAAGRAVGGSFVWDVRDGVGARVAPGIYYFMIATQDGKDGIAAKIAVI